MKAEERSTSPMIVDIWFLNVSLPASQRPFSEPKESNKATDLSTLASTAARSPLMAWAYKSRIYFVTK